MAVLASCRENATQKRADIGVPKWTLTRPWFHPISSLSCTRCGNWAIKIQTSSAGSGRRHYGHHEVSCSSGGGDKNRTQRVYDYWTHHRLADRVWRCRRLNGVSAASDNGTGELARRRTHEYVPSSFDWIISRTTHLANNILIYSSCTLPLLSATADGQPSWTFLSRANISWWTARDDEIVYDYRSVSGAMKHEYISCISRLFSRKHRACCHACVQCLESTDLRTVAKPSRDNTSAEWCVYYGRRFLTSFSKFCNSGSVAKV